MCDKQRRFFLFFNGEIYNFKKLQIDLISKNVEINSSGDSEILFKYLIKFGIKKTLKEINGMFAFIFLIVKKIN